MEGRAITEDYNSVILGLDDIVVPSVAAPRHVEHRANDSGVRAKEIESKKGENYRAPKGLNAERQQHNSGGSRI